MFALLLAAAIAQSGEGPAKMVLATGTGVTITDYSSMARCQRAREALLQQWRSQTAATEAPGFHIVVPAPFHVMCIPG